MKRLLNDNTQQYEKFRELAKKLFAVPKKELDEKLAEFKVRQQKKRAASRLTLCRLRSIIRILAVWYC